MNILDLIFEDKNTVSYEDQELADLLKRAARINAKKIENAEKPDPSDVKDKFKNIAKGDIDGIMKKLGKNIVSKIKTDLELGSEIYNLRAKKKAEEEGKDFVPDHSVITDVAMKKMKANLSQVAPYLKDNARQADKQFKGKSLTELAVAKKADEPVWSKTYFEKAVMTSDKAFIDMVSIANDLGILHNNDGVKYDTEYIDNLLKMLREGVNISTILSTLSHREKKIKNTHPNRTASDNCLDDAEKLMEKLVPAQMEFDKWVENTLNKKYEQITNDIKVKVKDPEEQRIKLYDAKINYWKEYNEQKKSVTDLENSIDKLIANSIYYDKKDIERSSRTTVIAGSAVEKINSLKEKIEQTSDPSKKERLIAQKNSAVKKYLQEARGIIKEVSKLSAELNELSEKRTLTSQKLSNATNAKKTAINKELFGIDKEIDAKEKELKKLAEKKNKMLGYAAEEDENENGGRYFKKIRSLSSGNFMRDFRESFFLMNNNLSELMAKIVNLLYFGSFYAPEYNQRKEDVLEPSKPPKEKETPEDRAIKRIENRRSFSKNMLAANEDLRAEREQLRQEFEALSKETGLTVKELIETFKLTPKEEDALNGKNVDEKTLKSIKTKTKNKEALREFKTKEEEPTKREYYREFLNKKFGYKLLTDEEIEKIEDFTQKLQKKNKEELSKYLKERLQSRVDSLETNIKNLKTNLASDDKLTDNLKGQRGKDVISSKLNYRKRINKNEAFSKLRNYIKKFENYSNILSKIEEKKVPYSALARVALSENIREEIIKLQKSKNKAGLPKEIEERLNTLKGYLNTLKDKKVSEKEINKIAKERLDWYDSISKSTSMEDIEDKSSQMSKLARAAGRITNEIRKSRFVNAPSQNYIERISKKGIKK